MFSYGITPFQRLKDTQRNEIGLRIAEGAEIWQKYEFRDTVFEVNFLETKAYRERTIYFTTLIYILV